MRSGVQLRSIVFIYRMYMENHTTSTAPAATSEQVPPLNVPFFRPHIGDEEISEVVQTLKSGWLTTGPKVKAFENRFAEAVSAKFAVAVNSCTAALHLAVEAIGLREGDAV